MKGLESVEHTVGTVTAGCGHRVDVRQLVYLHSPNGIDHACPRCAARFPDWP